MNLIIPFLILGLLIYYFYLKNKNNKYSKQNNLTNELIAYKKEVKTNKILIELQLLIGLSWE